VRRAQSYEVGFYRRERCELEPVDAFPPQDLITHQRSLVVKWRGLAQILSPKELEQAANSGCAKCLVDEADQVLEVVDRRNVGVAAMSGTGNNPLLCAGCGLIWRTTSASRKSASVIELLGQWSVARNCASSDSQVGPSTTAWTRVFGEAIGFLKTRGVVLITAGIAAIAASGWLLGRRAFLAAAAEEPTFAWYTDV
jgi:hypothetical protein